MKATETWEGRVYLGLQEGYNGPVHRWQDVLPVIRQYVDVVGFCVTVTPTYFCYSGGGEPGVIIGAIQYPRFPKDVKVIESHLYSIAHLLMTTFKQYRCTIVFPDRTFMLENEMLIEADK